MLDLPLGSGESFGYNGSIGGFMRLFMFKIAFADVLINEVLYDPAGSDGGGEWIELCNSGTETIDISGWTFESAGTSFSEIYTVAAGVTINP